MNKNHFSHLFDHIFFSRGFRKNKQHKNDWKLLSGGFDVAVVAVVGDFLKSFNENAPANS